MNIGIDIDDTISDTFETLLAYSQKYTIEDLKRESNINMNGDFTNNIYIEDANGWNNVEGQKFWDKYYGDILKGVNIKKFASDVIRNFKKKPIPLLSVLSFASILQIDFAYILNNILFFLLFLFVYQ